MYQASAQEASVAQFGRCATHLILVNATAKSLDPQTDGVPGAAQDACLLDPSSATRGTSAKVCSPSATFKEPTAWPLVYGATRGLGARFLS